MTLPLTALRSTSGEGDPYKGGQYLSPRAKECRAYSRNHSRARKEINALRADRANLVARGEPVVSMRLINIDKEVAALEPLTKIYGFRDHRGAVWFFDQYAAQHVIGWVRHYCRHTKGEWAGRPFHPDGWQRRLLRQIFGWFGADGLRRHREVWIEVPRKNGKSTLCAAIALYLLVADGEPGAEIYSVAGSEKQASIVYGDAAKMVALNPALEAQIEAGKKGMVHGPSSGIYMPLGKGTQHGLNVHGVIGDEVHEWKGRDQYEAVDTATGARRQPLLIYITTAGHDKKSLWFDLHRDAIEVRNGRHYQPNLYVAIWMASPDDDWTDPAVWDRCNPGLKHGAPNIKAMREACEKAQKSKAAENSFKRLHLNMPTDTLTAWISARRYRQCGAKIDLSKLRGQWCYAGLDLAETRDLTALSLWFPPENQAVPGRWVKLNRFWCPLDNIIERTKHDGVAYQDWADAGLIKATPGEVTDFEIVRRDIEAIHAIFPIKELGFDAWNARDLAQRLTRGGISTVPIPQQFSTLSYACSIFERMVIGHELAHAGHEIFEWNLSNTLLRPGPNGSLMPDKERSVERIDGVAADLNALALIIESGMEEMNDLERFGFEVVG